MASCWICLGEGSDDEGKPLRRDCSCRGSAGHSHLSCLVEYAKNRTEHFLKNCTTIKNPWDICPNCNQAYQKLLAVDLASECIAFGDIKYRKNYPFRMEAYHTKIAKYSMIGFAELRSEQLTDAKQIGNKLLVLIGIGKAKGVNEQFAMRMKAIEASAYIHLGKMCLAEGTKESTRLAVGHLQKCLDHSVLIGMPDTFISMTEEKLALAQSKYSGVEIVHQTNEPIPQDEDKIKKYKEAYDMSVKKSGKESANSLYCGYMLASCLQKACHAVEAERLVKELAAVSYRVNGPNHNLTQQLATLLTTCKMRIVMVKSEAVVHKSQDWYGFKYFQIIRYENDMTHCVLKGPITDPSNPWFTVEENKFIVNRMYVSPNLNTPVVCYGLKKATHLNNKLGETRGVDGNKTGRFVVHFEDTNLKPCLVKRENLCIVFELPKLVD